MKVLFTTLILLSIGTSIFSQGQPFAEINANNIKTRINSTGLLFSNGFDAKFQVPYVDNDSPAPIFAGGLWMGGLDPGGNIHYAENSFFVNSQSNYNPGLTDVTGSFNFDRSWKITAEDINALITDAADGVIDDSISTEILEWPAAGQEGLENIAAERLAAFNDVGGDGFYNPEEGDHPVVFVDGVAIIPDELVFTMFYVDNPFSDLSMDIHSSIYAFQGANNDAISNSVFLQQKIISREVEDLSDFRFSYFIDPDIGCFNDDYTGCDTIRNAMISYNADDRDGDDFGCTVGVVTYDDPPAISLTLLNRQMTHFSYYNNPTVGNPAPETTGPASPNQIFSKMVGVWNDDTPLTFGGTGYDPNSTDFVAHAFPGDPNNSDEWSMVSEDIPQHDVRTITTHRVGLLRPNDIITFDAVINFTNCPGYLTDITKAKENIDELQLLYDGAFAGISNTNEIDEDLAIKVLLYPNPSSGTIYIESDYRFDSYNVFDNKGQLIANGTISGNSELVLNVANGMYVLELIDGDRSTFKKFVMQR